MRSNLSAFLLTLTAASVFAADSDYLLHSFERIQLTDTYYSEGANIGDVNSDGVPDVVHGPFWFAGPDYKQRFEIYPARAQPRERYADNFFSWVMDFNGDGRVDVFTVGFPGTPAYVYENPGPDGFAKPWKKHEVFDWVSNESPQFTQLVGDDRPELVCTRDGRFGYVQVNWEEPFSSWTFHAVSDDVAPKRFGHGLGVGDVNGDERPDILMKDGWYEQPTDLSSAEWEFHKAPFAPRGGAEMYAYDVDGDGDNDVITSLAAHEFGLAWYEQMQDGDSIAFRQHLIMGDKPEDNHYGIVFSELHSVNLVDMDGDGLKDIVTGKTYWSHHTQSPMWDAGAVVYWFKLVRVEGGVDWIPYLADGKAGVGRQVIVGDVNQDQLPDIVVGGMKGSHVLKHRVEHVDRARWEAAQPRPYVPLASGLAPRDAARQMTAERGFHVELAAGEPDVHQPIAMAIDARGRVWVAEAYTYPIRATEGEGQDKIIILEDTDQDGTLDLRKEFATGLNLVSGLEVGFGGVWVGAAPYLMFIPDRDGDDVPDSEPEIVLDGFGYQDTHETLNAFNWGPDGWLYGCHGVFTHSKVGPPGTPDEDRVPLNAGIWRFHPVQRKFEVFAWGTSNPWGVDFNDYGHAFATACVIPHLYHVIQGARYQRQAGTHFNPYVFGDIETIADHLHYAGNIRDHAWWGDEPELPQPTSAAGGGHAHCGAMIYLGNAWPAEYRNQIFFNNIHGNRVNNDRLEPEGSGYVGRHNPDLIMANDRWFRGINLRSGPDGSVYLIDWYDPNACHRRTPEIWDRSNGRVYRIRYEGPGVASHQATAEFTDLSQLSSAELIDLQHHDNDWYVRVARRLLQERGADAKARAQLLEQLASTDATAKRLRSIWALHVIHGLDDGVIEQLLDDDDPHVRAWAIQLELEDREVAPQLLQRMVELAHNDPSPVVRLYIASALQRLSVDDRWSLAAALITHGEDAQDHNLPHLIWYGLEPLVTADPARAIAMAADAKIPLVRRYMMRRTAGDAAALDELVSWLGSTTSVETIDLILQEMLTAFEGRVDIAMPPAWPGVYRQLADRTEVALVDRADQIAVIFGDKQIFPRMRETLANTDAPLERRKQALDVLVRGRDADAATALHAALAEPALRGAALRALTALSHPQTPQRILAQFANYHEEHRRDAVAVLVARPNYALALFDAIEAGTVPRTDLHAFHIRQLLRFDHPEIQRRIEEVWGKVSESSAEKKETIAKLKKTLTGGQLGKANLGHGRLLFNKNCATCHTLFGVGEKVGPDITGSNRANLDYILDNVVDPSAVLGNDYRMTIIATEDGRIVSGLVQKETDSAVTLRTINDTVVVAKSDIDERQLSSQSLMPERLLDPLAAEEVRDLIAYLQSPTQVQLRGPDPPLDAETKRVPAAIEGESLHVAAKTAGSPRSQSMRNFAKSRWSGGEQLWWTGARPGDRLELELPESQEGTYSVEVVLTMARDYGVVQLFLDDQKLNGPIDLFNSPDVISTGVLSFADVHLSQGTHRLIVEILGANPKAAPAYMFGLDYVRLVQE